MFTRNFIFIIIISFLSISVIAKPLKTILAIQKSSKQYKNKSRKGLFTENINRFYLSSGMLEIDFQDNIEIMNHYNNLYYFDIYLDGFIGKSKINKLQKTLLRVISSLAIMYIKEPLGLFTHEFGHAHSIRSMNIDYSYGSGSDTSSSQKSHITKSMFIGALSHILTGKAWRGAHVEKLDYYNWIVKNYTENNIKNFKLSDEVRNYLGGKKINSIVLPDNYKTTDNINEDLVSLNLNSTVNGLNNDVYLARQQADLIYYNTRSSSLSVLYKEFL